MERHLSPAETAKRFGISIKALRLYEQRGLLTPVRTSNGSTGLAWRAYGPDQIVRLHRILALKGLGLPFLVRIAELLASTDALDPILELQERKLAQDSDRLAQALKLVRAARAKLASGQALSIDDLATLTKETVLNSKATIEEVKTAFAPIAAKHFTQEEKERFFAGNNAQQQAMAEFRKLVEKAMKTGDPASSLAREAARQYRNIGHAMAGGDPALLAKIRAFRKEAQKDPKLSEWLLLNPPMQDFIDQAVAHLGSSSGRRLADGARLFHLGPMPNPPRPSRDIADLLEIMRRLRGPDGCPWDREQTFETIAPYTVEEAYEVAAAIEDKDTKSLPDELGDLLFQVVFHARMAEEQGLFDFGDVVEAVTGKMIRRHPHVFGSQDAAKDAPSQKLAWEALKAAERREKSQTSILDDVPMALPALLRAEKLQRRAASVGFDWDNAHKVVEKIAEEAREVVDAGLDQDKRAEEIGDLLFVMANLARHLKVDPEAALRSANAKFVRRFKFIEDELQALGRSPADASLDEMEALWQSAKQKGL